MEIPHKSLRFTEPSRPDGRIHKPTANARDRDVFKGGRRWHYTPEKTLEIRGFLRSLWLRSYGKSDYAKAVRLETYVWFPRPKSHFKNDQLREGVPVYPIIKPDFDNLEKLAADALQGVAFLDDAQVSHSSFCKQYIDSPAASARWEIHVWELENGHCS